MKLQLAPEDVAEVRRIAEAAQKTLPDRYDPASMTIVMVDTPPLK